MKIERVVVIMLMGKRSFKVFVDMRKNGDKS